MDDETLRQLARQERYADQVEAARTVLVYRKRITLALVAALLVMLSILLTGVAAAMELLGVEDVRLTLTVTLSIGIIGTLLSGGLLIGWVMTRYVENNPTEDLRDAERRYRLTQQNLDPEKYEPPRRRSRYDTY